MEKGNFCAAKKPPPSRTRELPEKFESQAKREEPGKLRERNRTLIS